MDQVIRRVLGLGVAVTLLVLAGCSSRTDEQAKPATNEPAPASEQARTPENPPMPAMQTPPQQPLSQEDALRREQEERTLAQQRDDLLVEGYLLAARRFMENSDYERAERSILQALQVRPTDQNALQLLRGVRSQQGHAVDTMAELNQFIVAKRQLVRQQQVALVNDHYTRAMQAYNRSAWEEARIELEKADLVMRFDPYETDFGAQAKEVPTLLESVRRRLDQSRRADEEQAAEDAYKAIVEEENRRRARELEEIRLLMVEGIEAFKRGDFDNAEAMADKVLLRNPGFQKAKELKDWSRNARHVAWRETYYKQRREEFQTWLEKVREQQIPYTELLRWMDADKWAQLSQKRRTSNVVEMLNQDTDAVRVLKAKLANETITIDAGDEPPTFNAVIDRIRMQQGMNIVVANDVRTEKGEEPVRITLISQNLGTALREILNYLGLAYTFQDDVLYVTTKEKALGTPYPQVYDVRDLTVQLPHFKAPNLNLRPGPAGETAQRSIWGEDLEKTQETSIDRLVDLVRENVEKSTWETPGFSLAPSSGQIVAVTTPEIHGKVREFLDDLRRFTKLTVHVEARFISIQKGYLSDVGVEFRGAGGTNPGTVALLDDVTNGPPYNASGGFDNGQPGLPGASSLSPSSGAFYNVGNNGDLRGRTEHLFDRTLGNLLTNRGGATVQFSILDDTELSMLFRAIEKNIDNTIVNAPRLTIFNNQRANLTLVNQVSYVKDYDVEVAQTAFIADPLVDVVQDGLTLDVKPTVSHDRKYVTLEVQPTVATLVRPIRTFESNLSGLTTAVIIELPEIRYSQAATTVRVPDGGFVMIGGLNHVVTVDRRSETPILSQIPIVSFLFSRKGRSDEIRDLLIVLHVRIIDLTEAEANLAN